MTNSGYDFKKNASEALRNDELRKNLGFAMGTMTDKRKALFKDASRLAGLRKAGKAIRQRSLENLPELLELLERNCTHNGINVHWAKTTDQANNLVLNIIKEKGAKNVVKGKSMVSEEMHLNHFLEENGIYPLETDLGEFIIQLAGEKPSHIIVPAIHKNKKEIATLFAEKLPGVSYTEDVETLNAIARKTMRAKFRHSEVGISGVNFAVAETGTLCLVENEGNGRMCTTVPPVHIAVMGLEKVVAKLTDVPPLLELLTGSATGQKITTYFNMISSPRKTDEMDGPEEVHLILLDNGRTRILKDPELRQTLRCIRCGTCLNHCPVYTRIGGHAYDFVYPGPIGTILTPQMEGLDRTDSLPSASSLCNACEEVCPVQIPIPSLIRRIRTEAVSKSDVIKGSGAKQSRVEASVWKGWKLMNTNPKLNEMGLKSSRLTGGNLPQIGPLKQWCKGRKAPKIAKKSLLEIIKSEGGTND